MTFSSITLVYNVKDPASGSLESRFATANGHSLTFDAGIVTIAKGGKSVVTPWANIRWAEPIATVVGIASGAKK